jgi:hypothetical protein
LELLGYKKRFHTAWTQSGSRLDLDQSALVRDGLTCPDTSPLIVRGRPGNEIDR